MTLIAALCDPAHGGEILLRSEAQWKAHSRSLTIKIGLDRKESKRPACLHVGAKPSNSAPNTEHGFLPPVVDIWSGAMDQSCGRSVSGLRVERRFTPSVGAVVSLLEDAGDSISRHCWDGSQALAQHINQKVSSETMNTPSLFGLTLSPGKYQKRHVLELGCGIGTVGISIAQAIPNCDVVLTDLVEVDDLVRANIERAKPATRSTISFHPLDWTIPIPPALRDRANHVIIVSECTYNSDTLRPLVNTIVKLLAHSPDAMVVVITKTRHPSESVFFELMDSAQLTSIQSLRLPLPGVPGTGYADTAADVGLHVFVQGNVDRASVVR